VFTESDSLLTHTQSNREWSLLPSSIFYQEKSDFSETTNQVMVSSARAAAHRLQQADRPKDGVELALRGRHKRRASSEQGVAK